MITPLDSQLAILGRSLKKPWAVVKLNNTQIYALRLTESDLEVYRLYQRKDSSGKIARFEDGCAKYRFGDHLSLQHLTDRANRGDEIFVLPSYIKLDPEGDNGIGANFVSECPVLFAESDSASIEEQWAKLNELAAATGLKPSLVVFSGGKSLHAYFKLSEPITDLEQWKQLQRKLIVLLNSDPQLQNPNREMRAAGFYRASKGKHQSIEHYESDRSYSTSDIEAALDSTGKFPYELSADRFRRWRNEGSSALAIPEDELYPKRQPVKIDSATLSLTGEIPLEELLSRSNREALAGVSSERNATGFSLAKDLIGCADWAAANGISVSGDPYSLFIDYCQRCTSGNGWNQHEWESCWRSAQRGNAQPAKNEEGLAAAVSWWQSQNDPDFQQSRTQRVLEPNRAAYQEYLEWEKQQERVEEAQASENFLEWLKGKASGLSKHFLKGFGRHQRTVQQAIVVLPEIVRYDPELPLPSPSDYEGKQAPQFKFQKGQRLQLITRLKALGWKLTIDRSYTGAGKSHDMGLLEPDPESSNKIWYLDANHRNPSTSTIEQNYTDLPSRHDGLVADHTRHTPSGKPHLHQAPPGAIPDEPSLCHRAHLFHTSKEKGYSPEESTDGEMNPICAGCWARHLCKKEIGDGYGYKRARAIAMEQRRIRAHIDSLNQPDSYDYSKDIAVVEEAGKLIAGTQTITGSWADFLQQFDQLEQHNQDAYTALIPLKNALRALLNGEIEQDYYGLEHDALAAVLGQPPENIEELIAEAEAAQPDIRELVEEADSVSGCRGKWRDAGKAARSIFRREAAAQTYRNLENLPANLLANLLKVWAGESGALRVNKQQFSVTVADSRHSELIKAFGFTVFLDATVDKQALAKRLNIDPHSIIEIQEEQPPLPNLEVIVVQAEGMKSNNWSERCLERLSALAQSLEQQHPGLPLLGIKRYAEALKLEGWWFNHNRGSNEFRGKEAIAAFGSPNTNLGVEQDKYRTLYGSLEGFEAYYQHSKQAETGQFVGRPRAHLYPDQQFKLYLVGTDQDLSFLSELGIKVTYKQAFEICPEAGTAEQAGKWAMVNALQEAIASGKELAKITTTEVAQAIGYSQGRISQLASDVGGWREFRKLLIPLCNPYREINNFESQLDDTWLRKIFDLPPLEAMREAIEVIRTVGAGGLPAIAGFETRARLLGLLLGLLPTQVIEEVEKLLELPEIPREVG